MSKKYTLKISGLADIVLDEKQTREALGKLYGFIARDVVSETLSNKDILATENQIDEISSKLFDEIHDSDDEFFALEDKNIIWLASEMGLCDFDEKWEAV